MRFFKNLVLRICLAFIFFVIAVLATATYEITRPVSGHEVSWNLYGPYYAYNLVDKEGNIYFWGKEMQKTICDVLPGPLFKGLMGITQIFSFLVMTVCIIIGIGSSALVLVSLVTPRIIFR